MCDVPDCETPAIARGWCRRHYGRWYRTGDPTALRRFYAPTGTCAREGCGQPIKVQRKRPAKYCSQACYWADATNRVIPDRPCDHCHQPYEPSSTNQRYCPTCLGPPIETPRGLRYPNTRRTRLALGVSHPEWLAMVDRFGRKCWICRTADATDLDHSHATGQARGALCDPCNTRLHVLEDAGWLNAAQTYLSQTATVF